MRWTQLARRIRRRAGRDLRAARTQWLLRQVDRAEDEDLATVLRRARGPQARALQARITTLLEALDAPAPAQGTPEAQVASLEGALRDAGAPELWLALAVLTARLPTDEDVVQAQRRLALDGPAAALTPALVRATSWLSADRHRPERVEVVTGRVVVDMHHTSRTDLATGIQRVARETMRRWARDHDPDVVGWNADYTALARLHNIALARATGTPDAPPPPAPGSPGTGVLVPWRCTYVVLELATEDARTHRMRALARYSGNHTGVVGFDCVPLTTAETAGDAMGGAFALLLAAVRHMDTVAPISWSSGSEYEGWRAMLVGAGLPGPAIEVVPLPVDAQRPTPAAVTAARQRFGLGSLPVVLCVGSHEPRKNHLALLHAAELLWRDGVAFSLVLVGGNAWKSERFAAALEALQDAGRPVTSVSSLSDELLWAAYHVAHVVAFPSLNEGFGLPVAEALASGTPVVTSGFGSMAELARHGGALLVDPRDDHDLAEGLRRVLTGPDLHERLSAQAAGRPQRTWDAYAAELWDVLVADGPTRTAATAELLEGDRA